MIPAAENQHNKRHSTSPHEPKISSVATQDQYMRHDSMN